MKRYDCNVNLGGPILHLVPKKQISAAEMQILIHLHGDDCLRDVREFGNDKTVHLEEYDRLREHYDEDVVKKLFGPRVRSLKLPDEINLDNLTNVVEDDEDDDVSESLAERRARGRRIAKARRDKEKADAAAQKAVDDGGSNEDDE